MPQFRRWFVLAALVVGWAVDLLFWDKPFGISYLIWILLIILAVFILGAIEKIKPSRISYILAGGTLVLASISTLRTETFTVVIASIGAFGLLILLADTFRSGDWLFFRLIDFLAAGLTLFVATITRPFSLLKKKPAEQAEESKSKPKGWRNVTPVLRGILLAIPIVFILGALLSSADPIFKDRLTSLFSIFDLSHLGEYIFRLIYILFFAFIFTGAFLHALLPSQPRTRPDPLKPWMSQFLGFTEMMIVLVSVDVLFAVFVGIQFQYLFGGETNITYTGYTYAEYARRGFNELIAVAVISLALYLMMGTITRLKQTNQKRTFTAVTVLLVALVLVILASAFQRLLLYEDAYGFTQLRTYTHIFILWMAALLIGVIVFELIHQRGRFAIALLTACFGFSLTLGVVNVDAFIARQNIDHTVKTVGSSGISKLDVNYLNSLSSDAVPALIEIYNNPNLNEDQRTAIGVELGCRAALVSDEKTIPWQGFNLSEVTARNLLKQQEDLIDQYQIKKNNGVWRSESGADSKICRTSSLID